MNGEKKHEINIAIENYAKIREDYNHIKIEIQKLMEKEIREAVSKIIDSYSLKPSKIETNMIDTTRRGEFLNFIGMPECLNDPMMVTRVKTY